MWKARKKERREEEDHQEEEIGKMRLHAGGESKGGRGERGEGKQGGGRQWASCGRWVSVMERAGGGQGKE